MRFATEQKLPWLVIWERCCINRSYIEWFDLMEYLTLCVAFWEILSTTKSVCWYCVVNVDAWIVSLQTITGAMSTINPPVHLADPSDQFRVDYIQDVASQPDFDYPPVSMPRLSFSICGHLQITMAYLWLSKHKCLWNSLPWNKVIVSSVTSAGCELWRFLWEACVMVPLVHVVPRNSCRIPICRNFMSTQKYSGRIQECGAAMSGQMSTSLLIVQNSK